MPKGLTVEQLRISHLIAFNFRLVADIDSGVILSVDQYGDGIMAMIATCVKGETYVSRSRFRPWMTAIEIAEACEVMFLAFGDMLFSPHWKD